MSTTEPTPVRVSRTAIILSNVVSLVIITSILIVLWLAWPTLAAIYQARTVSPVSAPLVQPTAIVRVQQPPPAVVRLPGIAQNAATAQAQYDQAVKAAEQPPNTGQGEPAVLVVKPAEREPAGENVPTAEPVSTGAFGSNAKEAPVDIQATHQCKHGQVWIEGRGCKNP